MAPYVRDKRHLVGLVFVLIGIVLILDNITFLPNFIPWWIWSWQFLLIAIGVFSILTSDKLVPGVILIGIGTIFLLSDILPEVWPDFFHIFADDANLFWYVVLIIIGVSLILRRRGDQDAGASRWDSRRFGFHQNTKSETTGVFTEGNDTDFIDEVAIFGGGKRIITSENFRGGRVTTIFGGTEIIFSKTQLAPGISEIEVFSMFGGWTLVVPTQWQVKTDVVSIFGGVSDKRFLNSDAIRDNTRQLIIKGFVMFGGGEIKSF